MRILCITTKLCTGGVQTFLVSYARELVKYGVLMDFVVQTTEPQLYDQELVNIGCRIFPVCSYDKSKYHFFMDIYRLLKNNKEYKIVHTHLNFVNAIPLFASYLAGCPVRISHSHSNYLPSGFKAKILRFFAKIIIKNLATDYWACSQQSAIWLYGNRSDIQIIKNGVDYTKYRFNLNIRQKIRESLNVSDSQCVWLHVGTYSKVKNHIFILRLLREYLLDNGNVKLLLCGDGPMRDEIDETITLLGLNNHVMQLGSINNVSDYLQAADVFILPSLFEGLSFATIEAQASGLPVVVSNAIPDEALFGNYYKCKTFNTSEWIQNINNAKLLERTLSLEQFHTSGYSLDVEAKRLAELYMSLI